MLFVLSFGVSNSTALLFWFSFSSIQIGYHLFKPTYVKWNTKDSIWFLAPFHSCTRITQISLNQSNFAHLSKGSTKYKSSQFVHKKNNSTEEVICCGFRASHYDLKHNRVTWLQNLGLTQFCKQFSENLNNSVFQSARFIWGLLLPLNDIDYQHT